METSSDQYTLVLQTLFEYSQSVGNFETFTFSTISTDIHDTGKAVMSANLYAIMNGE